MKHLRLLIVSLWIISSASIAFADDPHPRDFSIIVLPDTQNESQYYPQVLDDETQWIVYSQEQLNIQAVLGLGDIVNNGSDPSQWASADAAFAALDRAGIPYFLAIGNHDYDNIAPAARAATGFNQWFGPARYAPYPWYLGNYNGGNENFYGMVNINGTNYLILLMEFVPRDAAVSWAASVLAANPTTETIVVTHSFLNSDGTRVDQCDTQDLNYNNYGDKLWNVLISQYPNIDLVLNGHITSGNGANRQDLGTGGNLVNQMFSNYQTLPNGGDGWLRILTFHYASDTISVQTYSPFLNQYKTDVANQFTVPWHAPFITATTGTISGKVRDVATCKAIPNAQVTANGVMATTDTNGLFNVTIAGGSYSVNTTATNYASGSQTAVVNNGYSTDTNIFLTYAPPAPCPLNPAQPSVTICGIANGAVVSSPLTILAGANDPTPVSFSQLYIDGAKITQQAGPTLNYTATLVPGTHKITVQDSDTSSAVFKQSISVTVPTPQGPPPCTLNTASPSVTICTPANNATVSSPLTVTAGTTDANVVANIQLWVDGVKQTQQAGGTLNATANLSAGIHRITVQAQDSTNLIFKQAISVTVPGAAPPPPPCTLNPASPSVTICTPANGSTVTSPVAVSAGTTDANAVTNIQLFIDGKGSTLQSGGVLSTNATLTSGTHRLTVQAIDSTGAVIKQTISVTAP